MTEATINSDEASGSQTQQQVVSHDNDFHLNIQPSQTFLLL